MENLNMILLSGGFYHCTSVWNAEPFGKESCYKLYFPVGGSARIISGSQSYELESGHIYFINGFMLDKYQCNDFMDVYWLHFIPESQFLSIYINNLYPVYSWKQESFPNVDFKEIPSLFDNPYSKENKLLEVSSLSLTCYINSVILFLLSDMSENQNPGSDSISYDSYLKLEPAVNFINSNYDKDLKLDDIAKRTFMNPIYFLRQFKKCFRITPNHYLNMVRLNEACRLLTKTNMPVKEIAEKTGFSNQFYFSKVFKSHYYKTPLEYRNTKLSP